MTSVTTDDESERRLAEALRARATGAGRPNGSRAVPRPARARWVLDEDTRTALLIALLGGVVLGTVLALLSLMVPGFLPALG